MSDTAPIPHDPALAAKAVALGGEGLSGREIAVALGMTFDEIDALQAADAGFAAAMDRAHEAERAWWEGLPRHALAVGKAFNHVGWRAAMAARFEDFAASGAGSGAEWVDPRCEGFDEVTRRSWPVVILPCNGKVKRLPDGSCPYATQDTSKWPDKWFATHTPRSCDDDEDEAWDEDEEADEDAGDAAADDNAGFAPEHGRGDEED